MPTSSESATILNSSSLLSQHLSPSSLPSSAGLVFSSTIAPSSHGTPSFFGSLSLSSSRQGTSLTKNTLSTSKARLTPSGQELSAPPVVSRFKINWTVVVTLTRSSRLPSVRPVIPGVFYLDARLRISSTNRGSWSGGIPSCSLSCLSI